MPTVKYARPFNVTLRDGTVIRVGAGDQDVPQEVADHVYAQLHQDQVPAEARARYRPPYGTIGHHEYLFQSRGDLVPSSDEGPKVDPEAMLAGRADLESNAGQFDHVVDSSTPKLRPNPPDNAILDAGPLGEPMPGSDAVLRGAPTTGFVEARPGEERLAGQPVPADQQAEIDAATAAAAADEETDPATGTKRRRIRPTE